MIQIFDEKCIHIMQTEDGFIAVFQSENEAEPYDLHFKRISVLNDTARDIDKDHFKLLKFGFNYEELRTQIDNYILTLSRPIDKDTYFTVSPDGKAKVLGNQGKLINSGNFCYQSCVPFDIAIGDNIVWASYPELNTAVRYNLSTLRQELRIGGKDSKVLRSPCGLFLQGQQLFVCNTAENQILLLDTVTFTVQEYLRFDEPVYQFIRVDGFNIVRTKSGVYRV